MCNNKIAFRRYGRSIESQYDREWYSVKKQKSVHWTRNAVRRINNPLVSLRVWGYRRTGDVWN